MATVPEPTQRPRITSLPGEILLEIARSLTPPEPFISPPESTDPIIPDSPLASPSRQNYAACRKDLENLGQTCRHFRHFIKPILHRSPIISSSGALIDLLEKLLCQPWTRDTVRHISITYPIKGLVGSSRLSGLINDPSQLDSLASQVYNVLALPSDDTLLNIRAIFALLSLAPNVERLHIRFTDHDDHTRYYIHRNLSGNPLWRLFVCPHALIRDELRDKLPPVVFDEDMNEDAGTSEFPLWPPRTLRRVLVEFGNQGGNFYIMETSSPPRETPGPRSQPLIITSSKHLTMPLCYFTGHGSFDLEGPDTAYVSVITVYANVADQPDLLPSKPSGAHWKRLDYDITRAIFQEFRRASREGRFDRDTRRSQLTTDNAQYRRYLHLLSIPRLVNENDRNDKLGHSLVTVSWKIGNQLRAIHLPFYGLNWLTSWWCYGPKWRVTHLVRFDGVTEVTLTTEAMLGRADWYAWMVAPWWPLQLWKQVPQMIPGEPRWLRRHFDRPEPSTEDQEVKRTPWEWERRRHKYVLWAIVRDLPPKIERLNLIEWFFPYANEDELPAEKLEKLGFRSLVGYTRSTWEIFALAALRALLEPLAEERPRLRKIEMRWHEPWKETEKGDGKEVLDDIVREYDEKGITLEFRDR